MLKIDALSSIGSEGSDMSHMEAPAIYRMHEVEQDEVEGASTGSFIVVESSSLQIQIIVEFRNPDKYYDQERMHRW